MKTSEVTAHLLQAGCLFIGDARGKEVGYFLARLEHGLGEDTLAFRLTKLLVERTPDSPDWYDVRFVPGHPERCECECLGYLAHRKCKHLTALTQLHADGRLS